MKLRSLALFVTFLFLYASSAVALESKIINEIPEHYALLLITNAEPDKPVDKDAIIALVQQEYNKLDVLHLQYLVYDKGKRLGDTMRVYGNKFKNSESGEIEFFEISELKGQINYTWYTNTILGYQVDPRYIYDTYMNNEVVADELFSQNDVILSFKTPGIKKDSSGKPYISLHMDNLGFKSLDIYIKLTDPFLRTIKQGSFIGIRARAKEVNMNHVIFNGKIIRTEKGYLHDGKIVPFN